MIKTTDLFRPWRRCWLIAAAAGLVGCSPQATPPAQAPAKAQAGVKVVEPSPASEKLGSLHRGKPVSEAEALELATAMQSAGEALDADGFASHFDWEAFGSLVLADFEGANSEARSLRNAFAKELSTIGPRLAGQIVKQLEGGGSYEFLRSVDRPEGRRLLFRLRTSANTLNYHEICLARRARGVRAVDLFVYTSGERTSETMQRIMLTALPPDKRTIWASVSGSAKQSLQRAASLKEMTDAFQRGESQRTLDLYQSLPPELQREKAIQIIRLLATQKIDETAYATALDEYLTLYPADPSVHLMSIDAHLIAKRFDDARQAIDRLDKQVGGDPYLQIMLGNTLLLEGKLDLAEKVAHDRLAADGRDVDAYWLLVSLSLTRKSFTTTAELLTKIRDDLGVPLADLAQLPDYADFVRSPAFAQWQKSSPK